MLQVPGMVAMTGIIPPWALPLGQGSSGIMLDAPWFQDHRGGPARRPYGRPEGHPLKIPVEGEETPVQPILGRL